MKDKTSYQLECEAVINRVSFGKFLRIPTTWFLVLMAAEGKPCADGNGYYKAVPPSFWKFTMKLWHETLWERKQKRARLSAELALRQFGIRPKDANLWAIAVVAGGLYTVEKGNFSSRKPSTYIYNTQADSTMWEGFYRGLMLAYGEWRASRDFTRKHGGEDMESWAKLVRDKVAQETALLRQELGVPV
jgi:hypothetical protein